jgi:Carboxypeptidase regulatory-like domain
MSSNQRISHIALRFSVLLAMAVLLLSIAGLAQSTVSTGSIVGTVTDPSGAVVSGAKVTITNTATAQTIETTSNSAGAFNSGALSPGNYKVQVSAKGFNSISTVTNVQVGNTATVNAKMQLGQESTTIEVQASSVQVNTEQATVQGVLNSQQIENLPVNGRNFLDLAQLEPGVQIQDGQNFDPTKAGYSSISFGGRFGRTARVNVDGVDVSDETVGTTTANIPASAIDEFQLSQSSLDLSQDLTSSGAVNVTTKSGTNGFHGEGFYFVRDHSFAALSPGGNDNYFQRHQYGGRFGGPVIKNKLFFFLDAERTKQDSFAGVLLGGALGGFSGGFTQPFREGNLLGKVDYDLGNGAKAFYRYSYFENSLFATFGLGFSVYDNKDFTRSHVVGLDFSQGTFSHSIRFSYLKFQNQIVDATSGNNALPLCCTGLEMSSGTFFVGPNLLAPQSTPQANHQIKYDGSKVIHNHTLRYGVAYNHIQGGGFADFYGTAPRVSWGGASGSAFAAASWAPGIGCTEPAPADGSCFGGGNANPLNYPVERLRVGNGQGFNTELPAIGFRAGGLGPDNRLGLYVGDSWKLKPNFTVSLGLRYDRDTGRTDSDLPADASINAAFPGAGNRVKQANRNFAPQIGIAWDPRNNGRTVIRAGIGMFYENVIFNNVLFDRPLRLQNGAFNQVTSACFAGTPQQVPVEGGFISPQNICEQPVGTVVPQILSFWDQVLAGNPFTLTNHNPNYIGDFLGAGLGSAGAIGLFDPNYKTPVSVQMNVGIQREIRHGMVFSADYLRNVETRTLLGIDINHEGSARNFNQSAALAAISDTNASFGCPAGAAGVQCAIDAGAGIGDYAGFGLGVNADVATGVPCSQPQDIVGGENVGGLGRPCAFGGINPNQASFFLLKPVGRSVYNALQMKLTQNVLNPVRGIKALNFQISYSLSDFSNTGGAQLTGTSGDSDQDFVLQAADYDKPGRYYGPALLDRRHQVSFGGYTDVPGGFRLGLIAHFYSPLSSAIVAPVSGGAGEIFLTDFTGDGTTGDPLPGTHLGQFDRQTDAKGLTTVVNNYNTSVAGQPTPAGQALVGAGLMTLPQLQALGGVSPTIDPPPAGQVDFAWLKVVDFRLAWRHTFKEHITIEPSVGFFNLFNFANFNLPPNTMSGILDSSLGSSINSVPKNTPESEQFRVGNGTGVYSLGAPRQIEFGMRLVF